MQECLPSVEDGTVMRWGPLIPSSYSWDRKAIAWIVLPRPWEVQNGRRRSDVRAWWHYEAFRLNTKEVFQRLCRYLVVPVVNNRTLHKHTSLLEILMTKVGLKCWCWSGQYGYFYFTPSIILWYICVQICTFYICFWESETKSQLQVQQNWRTVL